MEVTMGLVEVLVVGVVVLLAWFGLVAVVNHFFSRKDRVKDFWTTDREHREQHERGEPHDHPLAGPPS